MALLIPDKLNNFRAYNLTGEMLGIADVELPSFESMSETIKGAGIAGEYDSPTVGHFGSQTLTMNWRTTTKKALGLLAPIQHSLDLRGSIQMQSPGAGGLITQALRVQVLGQCKNFGLGKLDPSTMMESSTEVEVASITISIDGENVIEFDKFNSIFRVDGIDYLQKIRVDMGGV